MLVLPLSLSNCIDSDARLEVQLVLSLQLDLRYNVEGAVKTLMQMGTACALILLLNITRPSLYTTRDY